MKTLIVGDIHLKARNILSKVDEVLNGEGEIERIVFTGDICDEWGATNHDLMVELEEFVDWVEYRRDEGLCVDILYGNHDFQYLLDRKGPGTQMDMVPFVQETLFPLGLKAAAEVDGFLVTHAGLTQAWCDEYLDDPNDAKEAAEQLNSLLDEDREGWKVLFTCGYGRGGYDLPGPLWADKFEVEEDPVGDIPQIVGHTPVATVVLGEHKQLDPDLPDIWFCDTFSLFSDMRPIGDGSMLLVEDGNSAIV